MKAWLKVAGLVGMLMVGLAGSVLAQAASGTVVCPEMQELAGRTEGFKAGEITACLNGDPPAIAKYIALHLLGERRAVREQQAVKVLFFVKKRLQSQDDPVPEAEVKFQKFSQTLKQLLDSTDFRFQLGLTENLGQLDAFMASLSERTLTPRLSDERLSLIEVLTQLVSKDLKNKTANSVPILQELTGEDKLSDFTKELQSSIVRELKELERNDLQSLLGSTSDDAQFFDGLLKRINDQINKGTPSPGPSLTQVATFLLLVVLVGAACLFFLRKRSPGGAASSKRSTVTTPGLKMSSSREAASASSTVTANTTLEKSEIRINDQLTKSIEELGDRLGDKVGGSLEQGFLRIAQGVDHWGREISARLEARISVPATQASSATAQDPRVAPLRQKVDTIADDVNAGKAKLQDLETQLQKLRPNQQTTTTPLSLALKLEREALLDAWLKFHETTKELLDREKQPQGPGAVRKLLLVDLPRESPADFKASLSALLAPVRDFHILVTKLTNISKLVEGDWGDSPEDTKEWMRLRELNSLLALAQNSNVVSDRLQFHLETWVADHFLSFADQFIQRYQRAQRDDDKLQLTQLEKGLALVRQILQVAGLQPVELTLGRALFDSTRQICKSTDRNFKFPDRAILDVVRNGFMRDGQVLRQPEVIVNRMDQQG